MVQAETLFYLSEPQRAHLLLADRRRLSRFPPLCHNMTWSKPEPLGCVWSVMTLITNTKCTLFIYKNLIAVFIFYSVLNENTFTKTQCSTAKKTNDFKVVFLI